LIGAVDGDDVESVEDKINVIMGQRKMRRTPAISVTALPKNKTLEIFGEPFTEGDTIKHRPERSRIVSWIAVIKRGWLGHTPRALALRPNRGMREAE
jgi:hypothetical protein